MNHTNHLIIFAKNPELGKVKTRLAKTVGDEKALAIYQALLNHTASITKNLSTQCEVFYSNSVEENDCFPNDVFQKNTQQGNGLGEKMNHAFESSKAAGFQNTIIIGTDCYELSGDIIDQAFIALKNHDAVFGPAKDGGYYLVGLKELEPDLFLNKTWSTSTVLEEALSVCKNKDLNVYLLPELSDVDHEEDLGTLSKLIQ